jgi:hypothetical protein
MNAFRMVKLASSSRGICSFKAPFVKSPGFSRTNVVLLGWHRRSAVDGEASQFHGIAPSKKTEQRKHVLLVWGKPSLTDLQAHENQARLILQARESQARSDRFGSKLQKAKVDQQHGAGAGESQFQISKRSQR